MTNDTRAALIYCRISQDRTGAGLGVERQEQDCRALAERLGWIVLTVYTDNDLSAYSGKPRPGYRKMLADLEAGRAAGVLAWHTDRLHRSPVELEQYIGLCEQHGVITHTVQAGHVDLSTASGRMVARMLGAAARAESELKSERIRRQRQQVAEAGGWQGGPRPFGFEPDGVTHRPDEARVIREAIEALIAGESLRSIVRRANSTGLLTTFRREAWSVLAFRNVLLRPRNAGLRQHRGEIIGAAKWTPLVPEEQWRAVVAILKDPARKTSPGNRTRWFGSGLYVCGPCGSTMWCQTAGERRAPAYRCRQRGSGHVVRTARPLDDFVEGLIVARLSADDAVDLVRSSAIPAAELDALRTEASAARRRLGEIATMLGDGDLSSADYRTARTRATERLQRAENELAEVSMTSPLADLAGADDVAERWDHLDLGRRRAVLAELMTVTVQPIRGRRPLGGPGYFDPDSVDVEWKAATPNG